MEYVYLAKSLIIAFSADDSKGILYGGYKAL